jgi:hypothetical protein
VENVRVLACSKDHSPELWQCDFDPTPYALNACAFLSISSFFLVPSAMCRTPWTRRTLRPAQLTPVLDPIALLLWFRML